MRTQDLRFLRSGNLLAEHSGCVVVFAEVDHNKQLNPELLATWLAQLPINLAIQRGVLSRPTGELLPVLLHAFTEHARLYQHPIRVLHKTASTLRLWLPVDDRKAGEAATALCVHIFNAVVRGHGGDALSSQLWNDLEARFWNQTHAHLARAAQELGIPFYRLDYAGRQFLQLGQGRHLRLCSETLSDRTPLFSGMATNKRSLHSLLQHRGVPLPPQDVVNNLDQALAAAERIGWPVVLKPVAGGKGRGVWVRLNAPQALAQPGTCRCRAMAVSSCCRLTCEERITVYWWSMDS